MNTHSAFPRGSTVKAVRTEPKISVADLDARIGLRRFERHDAARLQQDRALRQRPRRPSSGHAE